MIELLANLAVMVRSSWEADRVRSLGALVTTALVPVTRPLRAIGLGMMANGVIGHDRALAIRGALVVAGLTAANRLLEWASVTIRMRLREVTVALLDQQLMALTAGIAGLEHHEVPELQDRLELLRLDRGFLVNPFMPIAWTLASVIQLVATVAVLARLHPILMLLPLAGVPSLLISIHVEQRREQLRLDLAEPMRTLLHLMEVSSKTESAKEVRVFDLGDELRHRHRRIFIATERRQVANNVRSGILSSLGWAIFGAGYMAAVAFVVSRITSGHAAVGAVVIALSMGAQLTSQLSDLVQNATWFSRTANAIGRFRWLRAYAAESATKLAPVVRAVAPVRIEREIAFRGMDFAYPGMARPVLAGVDLVIPAGTTLAIVGENGAGKTTLVKLLFRFYEPTAGSITIDGVDLRDIDIDEWRSVVSAGFQDFAHLQFVAQHSVGVGSLSRLDDQTAVVDALARAAAADVVHALPDGLATQLGREFGEGVELSIGQWQKLALGRSMMRPDPLLLVLDEPTASLDAHTEHALFERFAHAAASAAARNGAITILISHRFSTVRMADLIVVVADGKVAEVGDHDELMGREGLYAELFAMQAKNYD